jgi:hypothetical protein
MLLASTVVHRSTKCLQGKAHKGHSFEMLRAHHDVAAYPATPEHLTRLQFNGCAD